jgi:putative dimethyl sulfoxide reductase chaperone
MDRQLLAERIGLYSLLRALYTYPLQASLLNQVMALTLPPESPLADGLAQMQAGLNPTSSHSNGHGGNGHVDGAMTGRVAALNVEMTRLLEGPGRTPSPPYASFYLHEGRLMGTSAEAARRQYLTWRALPEGEIRLPDDHLALELGFLAHLGQIAQVDETNSTAALQASYDFLRQQVMPWLPRFCGTLAKAADEPFFAGLARFTQTAVKADLDWLTTIVDKQHAEDGSVADLETRV